MNFHSTQKLFQIKYCEEKPFAFEFFINIQLISMEVYTGSVVSVVSDTDDNEDFSNCTLNKYELELRSYTGDLKCVH